MLHRAGWTVADQALSSAGNFGLGLILARSLSTHAFGAFSLGFAAYLLALGGARALGSSVLQVRFTASAGNRQRDAVRAATGVPLVLSCLLVVPILVIAAVVKSPLADALWALAVVLPGLLLQDAWRFALFAVGRARAAAANDLVWVLVEFPLLAALLVRHEVSVSSAILMWGIGAYAAAGVGMFQFRLIPSMAGSLEWLRVHRDLGVPTLGEFLLISGTWPMTLLITGAVIGLRGTASLRAAEVLLGPLNLVFTAAILLAVPEGARLYASAPERLPRVLRCGAAAFAGIAILCGVCGLLLPTSLGQALVGPNWQGAHGILLPLAIHFAAVGLMAGALTGLRVLEAASEAFTVRLVLTPLYLAASFVGMLVAGALGAAWGTAVTSMVGAVLMDRVFRHVIARRSLQRSATSNASMEDP